MKKHALLSARYVLEFPVPPGEIGEPHAVSPSRDRSYRDARCAAVGNPGSTRRYTPMASILAGLLLLGGCNKGPAPAAESTTTAQATPAPAPAPTPAPAEPAPAAAAPPAPAPPPPPQTYTVAAGTPLVVRMAETVSAKNNNVGDTFTGTLAQSVRVQGVIVLRAGAPVTGTVVASKGQGRFKGDGALGIAIRRVGKYSVATSSYEKSISGKGKRSTGFIAGGGGGGALIGGLAGGGKGALIGGLLGAGAGTAGAAFTGNKDVSVPAESVVTFNLTAPVTVTLASQ
jgi:hypothetical protein